MGPEKHCEGELNFTRYNKGTVNCARSKMDKGTFTAKLPPMPAHKKNRPGSADSPWLVFVYIMGQNSRPRVPETRYFGWDSVTRGTNSGFRKLVFTRPDVLFATFTFRIFYLHFVDNMANKTSPCHPHHKILRLIPGTLTEFVNKFTNKTQVETLSKILFCIFQI